MFFNDTATTEIYTLSLHDALPILVEGPRTDDRHHAAVHSEVLRDGALESRDVGEIGRAHV